MIKVYRRDNCIHNHKDKVYILIRLLPKGCKQIKHNYFNSTLSKQLQKLKLKLWKINRYLLKLDMEFKAVQTRYILKVFAKHCILKLDLPKITV